MRGSVGSGRVRCFCGPSTASVLRLPPGAWQVRQALPLIPGITAMVGKLGGKDGAGGGAKALLQELRAYRSENFPTSADQDEELLR